MRQLFSLKMVTAILSLIILGFSLALYINAAFDEDKAAAACERYCEKHRDEVAVLTCIEGCLGGFRFKPEAGKK